MTANKPEVVAYHHLKKENPEHKGVTLEPLIRLAEYEALQAECDALRAKTSLSLGVGDGTGNLFVHGDYESIKRVQALMFECEKLRKTIRSLCNTYIVDDYYGGDLREERLNRAVERAIDAAMTITAKPSAEGRG